MGRFHFFIGILLVQLTVCLCNLAGFQFETNMIQRSRGVFAANWSSALCGALIM